MKPIKNVRFVEKVDSETLLLLSKDGYIPSRIEEEEIEWWMLFTKYGLIYTNLTVLPEEWFSEMIKADGIILGLLTSSNISSFETSSWSLTVFDKNTDQDSINKLVKLSKAYPSRQMICLLRSSSLADGYIHHEAGRYL